MKKSEKMKKVKLLRNCIKCLCLKETHLLNPIILKIQNIS